MNRTITRGASSGSSRGNRSGRQREGFFLVLVLIVIVVATMAVYSFTDLMVAYDDAAYLSGDLVQARVTVESASEAVRLILAQPPQGRRDLGGVFNNPQLFQAITVAADSQQENLTNYSVLAAGLSPTLGFAGVRFGLQDESAKLNINTLTILENNSDLFEAGLALAGQDLSEDSEAVALGIADSLLMSLPGMTQDTVDAILDWLDEDDEAREFGAEAEYYNTLATPYSPANGPLQTVEELLLVRGVTPTLLFGADVNRNGLIDPDEQQRFGVTADTPGAFGWAAYLTVHGAEANRREDGSLRVDVNQDDLEVLYEELVDALGDDLFASYIIAYRIGGQSDSAAALLTSGATNNDAQAQDGGVWTVDRLEELDLTGGGGTSLTQILDLVGSSVTIGQGDQARRYSSPIGSDPISLSAILPILMDALSTQSAEVMPGRLNINECPAELLYGIPLLSEEVVQQLLEARSVDSDDPNRLYETWPLVEGLVTLEQMRLLTPLWTGGGDVYRAQIVGYFEATGVSHRADVVIDATSINPKVIAWRDLSHLGRGFDLSVLGLRSSLSLVE
ncbi:MAG: general secretion pathway protein GspK [Rubripirellula sp.]|nr:general secretion pathway protein GspK [Rubripirellula sp.]